MKKKNYRYFVSAIISTGSSKKLKITSDIIDYAKIIDSKEDIIALEKDITEFHKEDITEWFGDEDFSTVVMGFSLLKEIEVEE